MENSKRFASAEQKLRLVYLVEADPQLKSGKFTSTFTKNEAKRRWIQITEELNSITGAKKTWEEWRKTWQDRKANAKKKFASLRRQASLTGGGPPPDPPTVEENLILSCFDQQSLVGHTDSQESQVTVIDLSNPESSKDEDGRPKIDFSDLTQPQPQQSEHENTTQHEDDVSRKAKLPKSVPKGKKRTFAQWRLQQGVNAAETLSTSLNEKNELKRKFYEDFINLMKIQTKAFVDIAAALNNKNNNNVD